ncbi:hypothetical protein KAU88_08065 [Candidatus Bathyarchaeota archaeon]|nr:hypothetical protein [Candidatus Bathyarchaeota archaeon]
MNILSEDLRTVSRKDVHTLEKNLQAANKRIEELKLRLNGWGMAPPQMDELMKRLEALEKRGNNDRETR